MNRQITTKERAGDGAERSPRVNALTPPGDCATLHPRLFIFHFSGTGHCATLFYCVALRLFCVDIFGTRGEGNFLWNVDEI